MVLGLGKDDKDLADKRPALQQAQDGSQNRGFVGGTAARIVENVLDVGIDGKGRLSGAVAIADAALAKSGGDVEKAVKAVVASHLKLAGASGFVTNVGGFVMLPVALPANVAGFYVLATRMVASVARLRGYDITNPQIRSAVLLTLVGAEADDLLAKAGFATSTGHLSNLAAQQLPGPALMIVNKAVGFRILAKAGTGVFSRFGRAVPLVGGAVGAGLDVWLLGRIADHARGEFPMAAPQIEAGR